MPTREQDAAQWPKDAWQRWTAWEAEWARAQRLSPEEALHILDAMLALARAARTWPPQTPWEGLDVDIRLARALNAPEAQDDPDAPAPAREGL